jgi:hypothetical protein
MEVSGWFDVPAALNPEKTSDTQLIGDLVASKPD